MSGDYNGEYFGAGDKSLASLDEPAFTADGNHIVCQIGQPWVPYLHSRPFPTATVDTYGIADLNGMSQSEDGEDRYGRAGGA